MYLSYLSTEHDTSRYEKFASILCRCSLNVKISPDDIQDIHQLSLVFMYSLHLLMYFSKNNQALFLDLSSKTSFKFPFILEYRRANQCWVQSRICLWPTRTAFLCFIVSRASISIVFLDWLLHSRISLKYPYRGSTHLTQRFHLIDWIIQG